MKKSVAKGRGAPKTVDEYLARVPQPARGTLEKVRAAIRAAAPRGATETISYAIPTFDLHGRHLVHFAAFTHHLGLYPTASGVAAFTAELAPYKTSKGAVQLPLDQPLPTALIRRIVEFRVAEVTARARR